MGFHDVFNAVLHLPNVEVHAPRLFPTKATFTNSIFRQAGAEIAKVLAELNVSSDTDL